jgi:hypothetical protein
LSEEKRTPASTLLTTPSSIAAAIAKNRLGLWLTIFNSCFCPSTTTTKTVQKNQRDASKFKHIGKPDLLFLAGVVLNQKSWPAILYDPWHKTQSRIHPQNEKVVVVDSCCSFSM